MQAERAHPRRVVIEVKRVGAIEAPLPEYQTDGAAGMDLRAATKEAISMRPLERRRIPTGLAIALPPGFEAQVRPRSGLAARFGVTVLNSPGTIDADYRGEIEVMLVNLGDAEFVLAPFERIAQLVIAPVTRGEWSVVPELSETARGAGGYGSTGRE